MPDSLEMPMPDERHPLVSKQRLSRRGPAIFVILLVIAGVVAMSVYLTLKYAGTSRPEEVAMTCDDVAIIGAGVGGTYAAWRLRTRNLSITMYELSDRVGGRMHTVHFPNTPDINVELGAMRFIPDMHPLINQTAFDLGLDVVNFEPGTGHDDEQMLYLRGKHFKRGDIVTSDVPYNLAANEVRKSPDQLMWEVFSNGTDFNETVGLTKSNLFNLKTKDGVELYKQSNDVAYSTIGGSNEGRKFVKETYNFYCHTGKISAALSIPTQNPANTFGPSSVVKTIRTGMSDIPKSLLQQFLAASNRHKFKKNHQLLAIEKKQGGGYKLTFRKTGTIKGQVRTDTVEMFETCARKVILAVPRLALETVDWEGLQDPLVQDYIHRALMDVPVAKVFLAYEQPWWRTLLLTFSNSLSDLPNRQTYEFGTSSVSNMSVMLAAYLDLGGVSFWRDLQNRGKFSTSAETDSTIPIASDDVINHMHKYLAELYNVSLKTLPRPKGGAISLWDSYPFGAGWQVWMPGYIWSEVQDRMIKPSPSDDVFIACNAFTYGHGSVWSESSLELVEQLLQVFDTSTYQSISEL